MGTRFLQYHQFTAQAVSSTTAYTSSSTDINQLHNIGLDVRYVGTMAGTLTVECSNDNSTFTALTFSPALTQPTGSALNILISLNQVPFRYVRTKYTNASGTGTITSILTAKDLA